MDEDNAADEIAAERLRSNGVDGLGPFGSVGSGAKRPGRAIVDPFGDRTRATLAMCDRWRGCASAQCRQRPRSWMAQQMPSRHAHLRMARAPGGAAGAMPRASVLDFALAIPLAIAVCGQGSGARNDGRMRGARRCRLQGGIAFSPQRRDPTGPRLQCAIARRGRRGPRLRAVVAGDAGWRPCGLPHSLRSVGRGARLVRGGDNRLAGAGAAGARRRVFRRAFPARAVIKGVAAPFGGFVVAGDERVGRRRCRVRRVRGLAVARLRLRGSGAGAGTSAGLAGTGAEGGVFATGVSTDRDDAGGTGDSDLEGDGDATDATDGADADAQTAPRQRRLHDAPNPHPHSLPLRPPHGAASLRSRALATVVGADDLPRASSTAPLASRSLQADHSCPSSGTLTAASTSTAAAHATRRGRRAACDRTRSIRDVTRIDRDRLDIDTGHDRCRQVATGIAMRVTGVGHSVRGTGCASRQGPALRQRRGQIVVMQRRRRQRISSACGRTTGNSASCTSSRRRTSARA
jgi:hypothetical protein